MRTLVLVRHAKAEQSQLGQSDFDRVLAPCGCADAAEMAQRLRGRLPEMDLLVASAAVRARQTAGYFATEYGIAESAILEPRELYGAGPDDYVATLCHTLPGDAQAVAVFAHNPTTHLVAELLSGEDLDDLPTCSVVRFTVEADAWSELAPEACRLCEVDAPKKPA